MKTLLNKAVFLLSIVLIFTACDDREYTMINSNANATVSLSTNSVVLTEETAADEALTVSWTEPDFGFSNAPTYRILFDIAGGDFAEAQTIPAGSDLFMTFTGSELNSRLLNLELEPDVEATIDIVVESRLSSSSVVTSTPVSLTVTPYSTVLDLSTTWGVVGSATPNGWDGPDVPFYQTGTDGVYVAYTTLIDGLIKFRENNDWALNYGDNGADGTLEEGGADIEVTAGTYKIEFNINDLTYTIEPYSWGIVGSAAPNGWDGPDVEFEYDPSSDQWRALVTLTDGEIKIRQNNDWAVNYGDDGADGTLELNGSNIVVSAGNYLVTFNEKDLTYTIEAIDFWGIVGSAAPNGWDGPDAELKLDYASDGAVWYNNSVDLVDGLIKFRSNNAWDVNYGDDGADGSLELNGADIEVTAGNYAVTINLEELTYSLTQN
ncbi:SusE domain-containing protein [Galbibacter sp. EGI 63066]|uniref:SusE domain-containing protein n=1 Tax=Galbibacter sp. EGI 63066 TaxID=2993559 RepID=UPI002249A1EB|nr:SusE domain-containing protein [Galbibacter sp. EGI 63066]MCX2679903.1 SusE domain-containing protein [Galbibacter sp. EGI 63066]